MVPSLRHLLNRFARSRKHPMRRRSRPWFEVLEDRTVPAAIIWVNPNGGLWTEPGNWSPAQVPGAGDDVTINVIASITVTLNVGAHTVQSLNGQEYLRVTGNGTSLTVTNAFTLGDDHSLSVEFGAQFTSNGTTNLSRASVAARNGGVINLPGLTSYEAIGSRLVEAFYAGSRISMPNVTLWRGLSSDDNVTVRAQNGGVVELPQVAQISQSDCRFTSAGPGSRIDLSALVSFVGTGPDFSRLAAESGGVVTVPVLTTLNMAQLAVSGGIGSFPNLTNIDRSGVSVIDRGVLDLPLVTSYDNTGLNAGLTVEASSDSRLSFPNLIVWRGPGSGHVVNVRTNSRSVVELPRLTQITQGDTRFYAESSNSRIELPALTSFTGTSAIRSQLHSDGGGIVAAPALTTLNMAWLIFAGSSPSYPSLSNIDRSNILVARSGILSLPLVTSYDNTGLNEDRTVEARDIGSRLSFPNLTVWRGSSNGYHVAASATSGGILELPQLAQVSQGDSRFSMNGYSWFDLSALTSFTGTHPTSSQLEVVGGGYLFVPALTTLSMARLRVSDGIPSFPNLANINRSSVSVGLRGVLNLPLVTSYDSTGPTEGLTIEATATDGRLSLPNLTQWRGPSSGYHVALQALNGGVVDLPQLAQITQGDTRFIAQEPNSRIQLPVLTAFVGTTFNSSRIEVTSGGVVAAPVLTTLNAVFVGLNAPSSMPTAQITALTNGWLALSGGGAPNFAGLTNFDRSSLTVSVGLAFTLPGLTSYDNAGANASRGFQASGAGSRINLPNLTSVRGGSSGNDAFFRAVNGGVVDIPQLVQMTLGDAKFIAQGTNSRVQVPALTTLTGTDPGYSRLEASSNGVVVANSGPVHLTGAGLYITSSGVINLGTLHLNTNALLSGSGTLTANVINNGGTVTTPGASDTLIIGGSYTQITGFVSGSGTVSVNGLLTWEGGSMNGNAPASSRTVAAGGLTLVGSANKTIQARTVINLGAGTWTGAGNLILDAMAQVENQIFGTIDVQSDLDIVLGTGVGQLFTNAATFRKSAGASGQATVVTVPFTNRGTVQAQAGELTLSGVSNTGTFAVTNGGLVIVLGSYVQTAGRTLLDAGYLYTLIMFDLQGGVLDGTNRAVLEADVRNAARIRVGGLGATGEFYILGNYTQTGTGHLDLELGGTNLGVDHDFLYVSGTMTLHVGSTLNISLLGAYRPNPDDPFALIYSDGGITGDFTTITGLDLGGGLHLYPLGDGFAYYLFAFQISI